MTVERVDVLINGGGIGGIALAYILGHFGHRVMLVEQSARECPQNGADLLKPSGIKILRRFGLLDDILREGGLMRDKVRVFHDSELLSTVDYSVASDLGFFVLIPCEKLRRLLMKKVEQMSSAQILFETRISEYKKDAAGNVIEVRLSDGRTVLPTVVVGADGANSFVRSQILGIEVEQERISYAAPMSFCSVPLTPSVRECNRLYVHSTHGLAYFYPLDGHTRLVISFPAEEMSALLADKSRGALVARLRRFVTGESADALDQIVESTEFRQIPIKRMNIKTYYKNNVALMGDAIHNINPITGQGMNLAIEDAAELARCLDVSLRGEKALADALLVYQETRHPINEAVVSYGHAMTMSFPDKVAFARNFNVTLQTSGRDPEQLERVAHAALPAVSAA